MHHLLRLTDFTQTEITEVFGVARRYELGTGPQVKGAAIMFFPDSSLRTRTTFELGAAQMGLQSVSFPPQTLDKPEALADVAGYLAQWADIVIARHPKIEVLEGLANANALPVVNAMTDVNHPCEVLSDLFSLARDRNLADLKFVFVGADGNIARAWWEAAQVLNLNLVQCCPRDLAIPGIAWTDDLIPTISDADVILTDGPGRHATALAPFQITAQVLNRAPKHVKLVPCPPFIRGREVSADAIGHRAFVGYEFKRALLPVQQAIMAYLLGAICAG